MADAEVTQWKKRFERERTARKSAEKLLEDKSLEIWEINQGLEKEVTARTAQLKDALMRAETASKAKDAFLSSMSHELRTPLNAIIGFSQILLAKSDTHPGSKEFLEKIQIAGKSLLSVVNTILDFSKIESGKMDYNLETVGILPLLKEVEILCEPLLIKKRLTLVFDSGLETMMGDFYLLKQALINLISNAIKFSPPEGVIKVEFTAVQDDAMIRVSDQGNGIDPEKIETLFHPFTQLANAKYIEEAGTGLGLMIIKRIGEIHGGSVGVENNGSGGATFWMAIPRNTECLLPNRDQK
jgi:two-component system, sensor histidine kinase